MIQAIKTFLFVTAAALAAWALSIPRPAEAECCRCTFPQITGEVCINKDTVDCDKLYSVNPEFKDATCAIETKPASCAKVANGGVCKNDPMNAVSFKPQTMSAPPPTGPTTDFVPTTPSLNINIPGLSFTPAYSSGDKVVVPYLAQYIVAFQKLLMGLGMIAAALMVVYGGFIYILGGVGISMKSRSGKTDTAGTAGKEHIIDALAGVAIIAGAYLILININPSTIRLDALQLSNIQPIYDTTPTAPMGNVAPGEGAKSNIEALIEGARMAGADPCNILALCQHETGLRQIWNGWTGTARGNPKEKSFSWGACSADAKFLRDNSVYDKKMRQAFPGEWPPMGQDLPIKPGESAHYENMPQKAELMINNSKMDGYLIGLQMPSATINSVANIGIGSANVQRWREANGCSGVKDITLAQAAKMGIEEAIDAACLPVAAAGGKGCPNDRQNCFWVDESKVNSPTKGYKIETSGTIHGKCFSTGEQCFTIFTQDHVRYAIKTYKSFDDKYHCTGSAKK